MIVGMPVIYLVRHGQASFGGADYDVLSQLGAEQAAITGGELRRRGVDDIVVVAGDLMRQRTTARLLIDAGDFASAIATDARWNEYAHPDMPQPANDQVDTHDYQKILDPAMAAWVEANAPDGWAAFQGGALAALEELSASLAPGQVGVAVTSGGTITAIVSAIWGLSVEGSVRVHRVVANASLTSIVIGRQGMNLASVNDHAHLLGEDGLLTYR